MRQLILASSSPYRRIQMEQLGLSFAAASPDYEEEMDLDIAPELLVKHLSLQKALSLKKDYPEAIIIGADQIFVDPRGRIIGKPGTAGKAVEQLEAMAGHSHVFYTGLTLLDSRTDRSVSNFSTYTVTLRKLSRLWIENYVARENPIDCAGSFKIEGLGIALMEKMEGCDYNSLIGLPLILLVDMLAEFGIFPLAEGC